MRPDHPVVRVRRYRAALRALEVRQAAIIPTPDEPLDWWPVLLSLLALLGAIVWGVWSLHG